MYILENTLQKTHTARSEPPTDLVRIRKPQTPSLDAEHRSLAPTFWAPQTKNCQSRPEQNLQDEASALVTTLHHGCA